MKMERKKRDSRVKTRKGQSRAETRKFSKTHGQSNKKEERKGNDQTAFEAFIRSSTPFEIEKFEPSIPE